MISTTGSQHQKIRPRLAASTAILAHFHSLLCLFETLCFNRLGVLRVASASASEPFMALEACWTQYLSLERARESRHNTNKHTWMSNMMLCSLLSQH